MLVRHATTAFQTAFSAVCYCFRYCSASLLCHEQSAYPPMNSDGRYCFKRIQNLKRMIWDCAWPSSWLEKLNDYWPGGIFLDQSYNGISQSLTNNRGFTQNGSSLCSVWDQPTQEILAATNSTGHQHSLATRRSRCRFSCSCHIDKSSQQGWTLTHVIHLIGVYYSKEIVWGNLYSKQWTAYPWVLHGSYQACVCNAAGHRTTVEEQDFQRQVSAAL